MDKKDWVAELVKIMARLRDPEGGCPWDLEQDHNSLKPYLIEESCEVLDAIDDNDMDLLREELGDVLMNLVFHAQLADEKDTFNFQDVARGISEKMIRRHPHVFAANQGMTPQEVEAQWEEIKAEEKSERESRLDGIPRSLPSLLRAQKLQKKAAKAGFDWPDPEGPNEKIHEELHELKDAVKAGNQDDIEDELGDLLFSIVNLSRHLKVDAEEALNRANRKFIKRFQLVEKECSDLNLNMEKMALQDLDEIWDKVKKS